MQTYKCKCGKSMYFGSGMLPEPCTGCDECGTSFYLAEDGNHKKPIPHKLELRYSEKTGEPSYNRCKVCYERFPLEEEK